ncbi:Fungal fucose-specific lectin [Neofusicoccum parvum]|uniref:Fungal fucose-specific lectin n=1 Tax=Neofusicoccum parvum TaxID=310453 RepID=A0ACB5SI26_9PEZI|nr:Fungal fucose-specific lectin [Neofusicoccum parvum]GME49447.1 Fungal fucose-specific lectin [Neofusicoccum parvum]
MVQPKPDYSTLEVDVRDHTLPEAIIKPAYGDALPEAINTTGKEVTAPAAVPQKSATICGLRRKTFWILLGVILLIVIGVAVGVGAGVGVSKSNDSGSSSSAATAYQQGIALNSRLASNNYTDSDGVEHSQVYYQDNSLAIWVADYNNATGDWALSEVMAKNNQSDMTPRDGTPIACGNWWHDDDDGSSDFRVLWADQNNSIRAVYVLDEAYSTSGWSVLQQFDNFLSIDTNSSLVEYLAGCNQTIGCNSADFIGFESSGSSGVKLQWFTNGGSNGQLTASGGGVSPDAGTAMAVAPIPKIAKRNDSYPRVAMYLVEDDNLVELYGGTSLNWENNDLTVDGSKIPVDSGAQLAATSQYRLDDFNVQILMTKIAGGVKMAYMNGASWSWTNSVDGMEDVMPLSPIAANQLGRVYAWENGTDTDNEPQLVEWLRITGATPKFQRIGVVNTTGSAS